MGLRDMDVLHDFLHCMDEEKSPKTRQGIFFMVPETCFDALFAYLKTET